MHTAKFENSLTARVARAALEYTFVDILRHSRIIYCICFNTTPGFYFQNKILTQDYHKKRHKKLSLAQTLRGWGTIREWGCIEADMVLFGIPKVF